VMCRLAEEPIAKQWRPGARVQLPNACLLHPMSWVGRLRRGDRSTGRPDLPHGLDHGPPDAGRDGGWLVRVAPGCPPGGNTHGCDPPAVGGRGRQQDVGSLATPQDAMRTHDVGRGEPQPGEQAMIVGTPEGAGQGSKYGHGTQAEVRDLGQGKGLPAPERDASATAQGEELAPGAPGHDAIGAVEVGWDLVRWHGVVISSRCNGQPAWRLAIINHAGNATTSWCGVLRPAGYRDGVMDGRAQRQAQ
jgi:hypothetical protein